MFVQILAMTTKIAASKDCRKSDLSLLYSFFNSQNLYPKFFNLWLAKILQFLINQDPQISDSSMEHFLDQLVLVRAMSYALFLAGPRES